MQAPQLLADRFEVGDFIARGGMGSVYRGRDRHTGETVAIKVLQSDVLARDPAILERFALEGEALRRLNHPNIVKLLTTFSQRNEHYLVLEYVSGGSLRDLLNREPSLSVETTLKIALELTDALTRCHHLNIIHRDIKPENVLLASDGTPRLTDFGIAHVRESSLTKSGEVLGTYAYLAPESWRGEVLDPRADLWSLGVLLFKMLTGQQPFAGDTLGALLNAVLTQYTPDLEKIRPDVPTALIDLIYRMLEKNRDERIPTARLVAAEMETILRGGTSMIHTIRRDFKRATITDDDILMPIVLENTTPLTLLHNLPAQTSAFVGREDELTEITRLLATDTIRLLTILGPGGMGKTRLALEATAQQVSVYRDGVYFVDLAPLSDPTQIVATIADAVRFTFYQDVPPAQQLLDYLREKHMLLLLDNFEHLVSGAGLITDILKAAADVKFLVTSRERLDLSAETILNISGLDFPTWETPEDALAYAAVKLFLQSARRAKPSFELTADMLTPVSRICRQVAGMPLGIVLAAAWVDMLTLAEIAAEIARSLDFLETEMRDLPTRQRSLRAVFEYSWSLLTPEEQSVFQRLSIFRGGFTREAAHKVSGASLRTLAALVNQSLLQRSPDGRYAIHELLRQYAESRLSATPTEYTSARNLHSAYYATYLAELEQQLYAGEEMAMLAGIECEFDNVGVAWNWAVEQRHAAEINASVTCLAWLYFIYNRFTEGHVTFSRAITDLSPLKEISRTWTLILTKLQIIDNEYADTGAPYEILKFVEENGLEAELGWFYALLLAFLKYESDPVAEARVQHLARQCLTLSRARNQPWELAFICMRMGPMIGRSGEYFEEAVQIMQEGLRLFRSLSAPWGLAMATHWCSKNSLLFGDYINAYQDSQAALKLSRTQPDRVLTASICNDLANISYKLGRYTEMLAFCDEALSITRELGFATFLPRRLVSMSNATSYVGDYQRTEALLREALTLASDHATLQLIRSQWIEALLLPQVEVVSARAQFDLYTELGPTEERGEEDYLVGKLALAEGNYDKATRCFETLLLKYPDLLGIALLKIDNLIPLGRALCGAGRYRDAEDRFQEAWRWIPSEGLQDQTDALCSIAELLAAEGRPESHAIATLVAKHPASTAETRSRATRLLTSLTATTTHPHDLSTIDSISVWILADDGSGLVRS